MRKVVYAFVYHDVNITPPSVCYC